MRNTTRTTLKNFVLVVAAILAALQTNAFAQETESRKRGLQGVWRVRVTPRNCVTGVPILPAAFEGLYTFHRGGTMSAWAQNATITTTRSPSHGVWQREHGWSEYSFEFVHLRYSLATGAFIGSQVSTGYLLMGESGDEFTVDGSTTVFDVNGVPSPSGCSNTVGTRFTSEP